MAYAPAKKGREDWIQGALVGSRAGRLQAVVSLFAVRAGASSRIYVAIPHRTPAQRFLGLDIATAFYVDKGD
jgi:hypothetical protein